MKEGKIVHGAILLCGISSCPSSSPLVLFPPFLSFPFILSSSLPLPLLSPPFLFLFLFSSCSAYIAFPPILFLLSFPSSLSLFLLLSLFLFRVLFIFLFRFLPFLSPAHLLLQNFRLPNEKSRTALHHTTTSDSLARTRKHPFEFLSLFFFLFVLNSKREENFFFTYEIIQPVRI